MIRTHEEQMSRDDLAAAVKATPKAGPKRRKGPLTPEERLAAIKKIVEEKQAHRVEGALIDLYSASTLLKVYEKVNDENKKKLLDFPVQKACIIAFKVLK